MTSKPKTLRNRDTTAGKARLKGIEVPGWVPKQMVNQYLRWALDYGEEEAASKTRALKRKMAERKF